MKKFLAIAIIAGALVACNNSSDTTKTTKDSLNAIDSSASAKKDSVQKRADSVSTKIDSSAQAKKDTLKKK
jgi:gas vesicle protein